MLQNYAEVSENCKYRTKHCILSVENTHLPLIAVSKHIKFVVGIAKCVLRPLQTF